MKVLIVEPRKAPYEKDIDGELKSMQHIVGGLIQPIYITDDGVMLVCNEEGKINGMPLNRAIRDEDDEIVEIIAGTFFICSDGGETFASLSEDQIAKYMRLYALPDIFLKNGGRLIVLSAIAE